VWWIDCFGGSVLCGFGKDTLNGKPILVVFRWDARNKERPIWGQAFSQDNGKTWEWNFFNVCERIND
jgi:hypothetical protein